MNLRLIKKNPNIQKVHKLKINLLKVKIVKNLLKILNLKIKIIIYFLRELIIEKKYQADL